MSDPTFDWFRFDNSALRELPGEASGRPHRRFIPHVSLSRTSPTPVRGPVLRIWVPEVAALLGVPTAPDEAARTALGAIFAGNTLLAGSEPFATRYGGHQFGHWADQLGDGRAISLGEVRVAASAADDGAAAERRYELQLKGAGVTPYSRGADGRAVLRSSIRELICSEAMAHLGVPTTRALCLVTTGEAVVRDAMYDGHPRPEPGAVVCRVAESFFRLGHFQIHAAHDEREPLRALLRHVLRRHEPDLAALPEPEAALELLRRVCRRTAHLAVHWQRVGFVHGVLNTDNVSILGLTIDYGPYGWLDTFDPGWTPNTTDAHGRRYRFGAQPEVLHWNLARFAEALLPLVEGDVAALEAALEVYPAVFAREFDAMVATRLGLPVPGSPSDTEPEADAALTDGLFGLLQATEVDPTLFFRGLGALPALDEGGAALGSSAADRFAPVAAAFYDDSLREGAGDPALASQIAAVLARYQDRVRQVGIPDGARKAAMDAVNPAVIPRNYLVQQAIEEAEAGNFQGVERLLGAIRHPYREPQDPSLLARRPEWARRKVGCSMLSCSS